MAKKEANHKRGVAMATAVMSIHITIKSKSQLYSFSYATAGAAATNVIKSDRSKIELIKFFIIKY